MGEGDLGLHYVRDKEKSEVDFPLCFAVGGAVYLWRGQPYPLSRSAAEQGGYLGAWNVVATIASVLGMLGFLALLAFMLWPPLYAFMALLPAYKGSARALLALRICLPCALLFGGAQLGAWVFDRWLLGIGMVCAGCKAYLARDSCAETGLCERCGARIFEA